jgi:hypothetical protein
MESEEKFLSSETQQVQPELAETEVPNQEIIPEFTYPVNPNEVINPVITNEASPPQYLPKSNSLVNNPVHRGGGPELIPQENQEISTSETNSVTSSESLESISKEPLSKEEIANYSDKIKDIHSRLLACRNILDLSTSGEEYTLTEKSEDGSEVKYEVSFDSIDSRGTIRKIINNGKDYSAIGIIMDNAPESSSGKADIMGATRNEALDPQDTRFVTDSIISRLESIIQAVEPKIPTPEEEAKARREQLSQLLKK